MEHEHIIKDKKQINDIYNHNERNKAQKVIH